ncbi:putative sugar O-methyltransferase [Amycolatopsis sp.]|uniref:putative sugar O-methyltransferase n=1 Tax=Amycolatopsis sp. TaxID=37632 RepID=UPI002D7FB3F5|nr:putative sugar O-methyltransferase [Amycolatopsis sp.]HET6707256.1 putative sugar O-methyltransferase [Amycolatopsis sp.]
MTGKYGRSALWEQYNRTHVTRETTHELAGFKSGAPNFKMALWDPKPNGVRYLKTLIYNLAEQLSPDAKAALRRIRHREVGDPISVRVDGEPVCLDYLQAVLELEFVTGHVELTGARVVEIGAGYGRTCHAFLSNHDLSAYYIVDLDNSLTLAEAYLGAVLTEEQFAKVGFVRVDDVEDFFATARFDLCVNIDSFAEMDAATVLAYLALVDRSCRYCYIKNPVGKYLDKTLDSHSQGAELVELALRTGLARDVLDIHDSDAVAEHGTKFVATYRPGPWWTDVAAGRALPWSYYWQVLYRRARP